jgi:hypothetical protein
VKVTVEFPHVGRRRLVCVGVLSSIATALWIAPAYLPFSDVSALLVLAGVAVPFGVGWVTLLLMERRIARDMVRVVWVPQEERKVREDLMS